MSNLCNARHFDNNDQDLNALVLKSLAEFKTTYHSNTNSGCMHQKEFPLGQLSIPGRIVCLITELLNFYGLKLGARVSDMTILLRGSE